MQIFYISLYLTYHYNISISICRGINNNAWHRVDITTAEVSEEEEEEEEEKE